MSNTGRQCMKWSDLDYPLTSRDLPDDSISDAKDFCRSEAFSDSVPGCFVDLNVESIDSHEECYIPYCGML